MDNSAAAIFKSTVMNHTSGMMDSNQNKGDVELLAPAGDWECVRAAVENGADAIYFGLDCGFNARYRAKNFGLSDLPQLADWLHRRSVKGYATLNTLIFPDEMSKVAKVVEAIATAGIDAVLVQDFGVARLVKAICPELEIHASTQMSLTSAETIAVAQQLGLSRVVLARELSVKEVRRISQHTEMPLEVFIHGALCVAYSGQCLTSESLGGRSANRGQCAQACRLPYEVISDGETQDLGDVRYLLSPQDLAGYASIADLYQAGVASFKIEGRLKSPEYVANITNQYRQAINAVIEGQEHQVSIQDQQEMELSFSRGFSPGWLQGNDHKRLVPGLDSAKRGILLGEVTSIRAREICLRPQTAVSLGDGLAIRCRDESDELVDQGGRVYSLKTNDNRSLKHTSGCQTEDDAVIRASSNNKNGLHRNEQVWIGFGAGEIDFSRIAVGDAVFKNDDPKLNRRLRKSYAGEKPHFRRRIDLCLEAKVGDCLRLSTVRVDPACENALGTVSKQQLPEVTVRGEQPLSKAINQPANREQLREKLSRLGGTPFFLGDLDVRLEGQPMVPVGMLNQLRRDLVDRLLMKLVERPSPLIDRHAGESLLQSIPQPPQELATQSSPAQASLAVLCRTVEQVKGVVESDIDLIYADFHDVREYREAVKIAHGSSKKIGLASVRIQKPSEMGLLRAILKHSPDYLLCRNLAAIQSSVESEVGVVADFSLNVANHRSAEWIRSLGAERVTVSYDLNREQVSRLCDTMPNDWLEVVIHQHMPMFHMEHCVFCSVLSPGTDKTNCGRPCDRHQVKLRDRVGAEHPLHADVACRNTLYNSIPQSGAEITSELQHAGVKWFRIELLEEAGAEASKTVALYRQLLDGGIEAREVWSRLKASNRLGVTRGTLESKRNPLAIL